jgi:hypothetical protein
MEWSQNSISINGKKGVKAKIIGLEFQLNTFLVYKREQHLADL